jgi:hypothetical protein
MARRLIRGLAAAALLTTLAAGAAYAGGWATITADDANPRQPVAGEEFTFGFTVLQHGQTPAGWENPTFVATNPASGERIESAATGEGADGHFVARLSLPSGGVWSWRVELRDLLVETPPAPFTVLLADGSLPAVDPAEMITAMERVRLEVSAALQGEITTQTAALRADVARLDLELDRLLAQRADLESRLAAETDGGTLPLGAVLALGVLAGAIAGFAITWLGRAGPTSAAQAAAAPAPTQAEPTTALSTR